MTKSWRDVLPIHPAAELFPRMTPEELRALGEDIKTNGLREPVVLYAEEGGGGIYRETAPSLLDGINRLDAMEVVGLPTLKDGQLHLEDTISRGYLIKYGLWKSAVTGFDPYAYVVSLNIHRRHLTAEQKRELIVKLLKADPTKSNRQVAKLTKTSHPHVAKVREKAEKAGDVETVTTSIDTKGRQQPAKKPRKAGKKSDQRVRRRPTDGETLIDELLDEAAPDKPKRPRRPARKKWEIIHERQALVQRLVAVDRELVVLLSKFFGKYPEMEDSDGDGAARAAEPEASAEAMKAKFAEIDDGLDIPASLRRAAP